MASLADDVTGQSNCRIILLYEMVKFCTVFFGCQFFQLLMITLRKTVTTKIHVAFFLQCELNIFRALWFQSPEVTAAMTPPASATSMTSNSQQLMTSMSRLEVSSPPAPVPTPAVEATPPPSSAESIDRKEDAVYAAVTEVVRAVSDMTKQLKQTNVEQYVELVKVGSSLISAACSLPHLSHNFQFLDSFYRISG